MKPVNSVPDRFGAKPFTVAIGYENYESGLRAVELYQRLVRQWSSAMDFQLLIWKFEPLGIEQLLKKAIEDTACADLVIISLSGNHELPGEARAWVDGWTRQISPEAAVAFLSDGKSGQSGHAPEIERYLRAMAEGHELSFFSSMDEPRSEHVHRRFANHIFFDAPPVADHWGINE